MKVVFSQAIWANMVALISRHNSQTDTSLHCDTADTVLVHHVV